MEKKEIGKLLELLNKYEKEKEKSEGLSMYTWEILTGCLIARSNYSDNLLDISEPLIYGKSYGFIKWLVDNDKIDIEKVIDTAKSSVIDTYYYEEGIDDIYIPLLMVLAVEDEPIEFLISILK